MLFGWYIWMNETNSAAMYDSKYNHRINICKIDTLLCHCHLPSAQRIIEKNYWLGREEQA